jgi:hypothetical protein
MDVQAHEMGGRALRRKIAVVESCSVARISGLEKR